MELLNYFVIRQTGLLLFLREKEKTVIAEQKCIYFPFLKITVLLTKKLSLQSITHYVRFLQTITYDTYLRNSFPLNYRLIYRSVFIMTYFVTTSNYIFKLVEQCFTLIVSAAIKNDDREWLNNLMILNMRYTYRMRNRREFKDCKWKWKHISPLV